MLLPVGDYYAIDYNDKYGTKKSATVVYESDNRGDAEQACDRLKVVGCEVYAEVGEKHYRVICEQERIVTYATRR